MYLTWDAINLIDQPTTGGGRAAMGSRLRSGAGPVKTGWIWLERKGEMSAQGGHFKKIYSLKKTLYCIQCQYIIWGQLGCRPFFLDYLTLHYFIKKCKSNNAKWQVYCNGSRAYFTRSSQRTLTTVTFIILLENCVSFEIFSRERCCFIQLNKFKILNEQLYH